MVVFRLDHVVPWGRSFDEYSRMFALDRSALRGRILGCADGPSSFNAELSARGGLVTSVDPIYRFKPGQLSQRFAEVREEVIAQTRENSDRFVWDVFSSVEELERERMSSMSRFLSDFESAHHGGRYVAGKLPDLPIAAGSFELAVCSHFLFLYSDQLGAEFHVASVDSLCRCAREVRIFPIIDLAGRHSAHLGPVCAFLKRRGAGFRIERVPYEFQRGGNQMLRITT